MGNTVEKAEIEQGGATLTGLQRSTDEPLTETRKNGNVELQPFQRFTDEELGADYWIW